MAAPKSQADALLADLNEPQRLAVTHHDGPLLVIAGPGSGKTRVITRRAAHLVHSGVPARNVLAITFTNKAADEMKRRIEALGVGRGMWVYTFHALGVRLLREFGPLARLQPGFSIYDEADSLRVVKEAMAAADISKAVLRPEDARAHISRQKNQLRTPAECADSAGWFEQDLLAKVYAAYEQLLEQRNAVDFDDLLMRVAIVLRDHADIAERLNIRFRYVLIDEYQDTNHAQYLIARYLSLHHRNICATGDPDQSIYAWRGANIRNILEFEQDYPDAAVVRLEQNYRSTSRILDAASRLIRGNRRRKHKDLWSDLGPGAPVHVWRFAQGHDETERIAARIAELHAAGTVYSDIAIVYRINALSRGLEDALRNRAIPYKIVRGVEFYSRREIRDVLAYLRVLVNPSDEVALLRIINTPTRGIGNTTVERLRTAAAEQSRSLVEVLRAAEAVPALGRATSRVRAFADLLEDLRHVLELPPSEAVSTVLKLSGLEAALKQEDEDQGEDRLANVQELVTAALRYENEVEEPTLEDFLARTSLISDQDAIDEAAGCVLLMTMHAAKGLEFEVVFITGLEQGLLPHERSLNTDDIEEERRLCFVGITRAKRLLHLSFAGERLIRGVPTARAMSQFVQEIDDGGLEWETHAPDFGAVARRAEDDDFEPFVDDLPTEEAARLVPKRGFGARASSSRGPRPRPRGRASEQPPARVPGRGKFADWQPGMLVQHERYGVGQLVWIRPAPEQTRAGVRFAGYGEKTLILEFAPIRKLERR